jgi:hypothetical protein
MKIVRTAILLAGILLAGCATRQPEPATTVPERRLVSAQERPGLGTSWGEQRQSWVEPVTFNRAAATRPNAGARIYYNDREGVDAMLDFLRGESKRCDGLQACAGDRLRVGMRNGNGSWIECHELRGRRIAVGESGNRYEIVLRNDSRRAIEVVVSVDGLDVIDGKSASMKKRGYMIAPFQTIAVDGFRTGAATVAAFRFGSMTDSYGRRRHGNTANAGVIGIGIFEENRRAAPAGSPDPASHAWRFTGARPAPTDFDFSTPPEA